MKQRSPEGTAPQFGIVTKQLREQIKAAKAALADIQQDEAQRERLAAEIESLQGKVNYRDEQAVHFLSLKQNHLTRLDAHIAEAEERVAPFTKKLRDFLGEVPDAVRASLVPHRKALVARVENALRPFIRDSASRLRVANETDAVRAFDRILACQWFPSDAYSNPLECGDRVLSLLESLQLGEQPWLLD